MDRLKARVYVAFGNLAIPSRRHVRMGRSLARQAFDTAQRAGDLTYAAFSCNFLLTELLAKGIRWPRCSAKPRPGSTSRIRRGSISWSRSSPHPSS